MQAGEYDPLGVPAPEVPGLTFGYSPPYNSGSFGSPDMGCTVDRIPAPCGLARRLISSGAAVPCRNNDCGARMVGGELKLPYYSDEDGFSYGRPGSAGRAAPTLKRATAGEKAWRHQVVRSRGRDPFGVGYSESYSFSLVGFYPQNPTMVQPSKPIPGLVRDLLKKADCADYVQKLLNKANDLFAGKYPHVNTISEAMDMIDKAGGYQLDGKDYHTVSGDLFYKGGGAQPGTVHILPFRTIGTPSAANVAYAQEYYAIAGLHETFHLARQGGYNDELMATTAFALAGQKLPTPPAKLDGYGRAAFFSALFDVELLKHCPKR